MAKILTLRGLLVAELEDLYGALAKVCGETQVA